MLIGEQLDYSLGKFYLFAIGYPRKNVCRINTSVLPIDKHLAYNAR